MLKMRVSGELLRQIVADERALGSSLADAEEVNIISAEYRQSTDEYVLFAEKVRPFMPAVLK